ncbi:spore germination protein KC [Lederbergia ruris]|uniref:Spore germination protein KC n=1 Tax=Lederbergia ruris TaxID=217495 RepID=A0ABQ4KP87_9BACI|nr:Ger(x)C family spore germination protein [Lederbergia ruris]GIN59311.1 spore germination protein KC [Lederbergia ruris]
MIRKVKLSFILLISLLFLAGCWDKRELTDIAFVAAIGFDKGEDNQYIGTFQIVNPGNVAGGLQGGSASEAANVTVYQITGKNTVEISRRASEEISRTLFYSHANLVVVGEELAKEEGFGVFLDGLDRDDRFRDTAKVIIARNTTASELMQITTPIDKIPANKVTKTLEYSGQLWGAQWPINIRELLNALTSAGKEPIIPSFSVHGHKEVGKSVDNLKNTEPATVLRASGLGIFNNGKLIGWLDGERARGVAWVMNKIRTSNIAVDWQEQKDVISFQVVREKTKVALEYVEDQITAKINIQMQGDLGEVNVPINIKDRQIRNQIERETEKAVESMVRSTIEEVQSYKSDIFGFGEKVYQSHPDAWKKMKKNWDEQYFPDMKVEIEVDATITGTGLRSNPFKYKRH